MKSIYHFLRLSRFANLLVIGLTMCVFQLFISKYLFISIEGNWANYSFKELFDRSILGNAGFLLLILSTLLTAAAGNIINDYFDVKADRVNKPERLIVGRHIKRRWAMLFHWSFNSIGILIAAYVSYVHQNWLILVISFISINILWFYSAIYKRKFLSGNLMMAFLVALVPIYVLVFNMNSLGGEFGLEDTYLFDPTPIIIKITLIVAGTAFLINLNREIIKDIADIRGDLHLGSRTLPIVLGKRKAKGAVLITTFFLLMLIVWYLVITFLFTNDIIVHFCEAGKCMPDNIAPFDPDSHFLFLAICSFTVVISIIILLISDKRKTYLLSSNFLKLAMLFGLLSPLFL